MNAISQKLSGPIRKCYFFEATPLIEYSYKYSPKCQSQPLFDAYLQTILDMAKPHRFQPRANALKLVRRRKFKPSPSRRRKIVKKYNMAGFFKLLEKLHCYNQKMALEASLRNDVIEGVLFYRFHVLCFTCMNEGINRKVNCVQDECGFSEIFR